MNTVTAIVALFSFVVNGTLFAFTVRDILRRQTAERAALVDVIVARHAGDLGALRRAPTAPPKAVRDFAKELEEDLKAMGYEPGSVPALPEGL